MADPFLGQIMQVGFNFAPVNWAIAGGQTIGISQNAALFALIGTTFGGNGTSTFQLPNLQSRVVVGVGQSAGLSPYVWGQQGGQEQVTLNVSQMPMHTHVANFTPPTVALQAVTGATAGTAQNIPPAGARLCNPFDNAASGGLPQIYLPTGGTPVNLANLPVSGGSVTNALTGGNIPTQIVQPYLALLCIISMSGIFPTRG